MIYIFRPCLSQDAKLVLDRVEVARTVSIMGRIWLSRFDRGQTKET